MKRHLDFLDGLRGLASLSVALFHMDFFFGVATSSTGGYGQDSLIWQCYRLLFDGNFAVCVFFILSGYSLLISYHSGKNDNYLTSATIKRYLRLSPLVAFSVLFSYLLWENDFYLNKVASNMAGGHTWFHDAYTGSPYFIDALYQSIIGVYAGETSYNGPLWTIRIEFFSSLFIFAHCALFYKKKNFNIISTLSIIFMITLFGVIGVFFSLFLAGTMIHRLGYGIKYKYLIFPAIILSCQTPWSGLTISIADFTKNNTATISTTLQAISSVLLMLSVINSPTLKRLLSWYPLVHLGRISFSMYALHLPIIMSIGSATFIEASNYVGNSVAALLAIVTSLGLMLLISYAAYRFIDLPSQRAARLVGDKLAV